MDFAFDEDQRSIQDLLRDALGSRSSLADVAAVADGAPVPAPLWRMLTHELGALGLCLPEEVGGQGLGWVELAILLEECGRAGVPAPVRETVLVLRALAHAGEKELTTRLLDEGAMVGLAVAPGAGGPRAEKGLVTGELAAVAYASDADYLLVVAEGAGATRPDHLDLVAAGDTSVGADPVDELDPTRRSRSVTLVDVPALAEVADGDAVTALRGGAILGRAAEMLGVAQRCLDLTVEHVTTRHQFDRPIGSFQAVKHQCADMLVEIELARTAVYLAACRAEETSDPSVLEAEADKAFRQAARAGKAVAATSVQLHGGIGFTWEHPLHLLVKRLRSGAHLGAA